MHKDIGYVPSVAEWLSEGAAKEDAMLKGKQPGRQSGTTPHGLLKKRCRDMLKELRAYGSKACVVPIHNISVEKKNPRTGQVQKYMTGRPGASDDIILWHGIGFAVEYKAGRDTQSPKQKLFEDAWTTAGGVYIVARDALQLKTDMLQVAHQRGRVAVP